MKIPILRIIMVSLILGNLFNSPCRGATTEAEANEIAKAKSIVEAATRP